MEPLGRIPEGLVGTRLESIGMSPAIATTCRIQPGSGEQKGRGPPSGNDTSVQHTASQCSIASASTRMNGRAVCYLEGREPCTRLAISVCILHRPIVGPCPTWRVGIGFSGATDEGLRGEGTCLVEAGVMDGRCW